MSQFKGKTVFVKKDSKKIKPITSNQDAPDMIKGHSVSSEREDVELNKKFLIHKLLPADESNDRGKRTWEWKMKNGPQVTVYRRNQGEKFGFHFHKGNDPSKNPERLLLLAGVASVKLSDMGGHKRKITLDASQAPVELVIYPYILHELKALKNCVYIEFRQTHFDPTNQDCYPVESFPKKAPLW